MDRASPCPAALGVCSGDIIVELSESSNRDTSPRSFEHRAWIVPCFLFWGSYAYVPAHPYDKDGAFPVSPQSPSPYRKLMH